MPPKALSVAERDILHGLPSALEQHIMDAAARQAAREAAARRSTAIQQGMQRAAAHGVHIGRPSGTGECPALFLAKPASQRVLAALRQGVSLRKTSQETGVAVNTVRKVAALLHTTAPVRS
jgi:hypothetical protein